MHPCGSKGSTPAGSDGVPRLALGQQSVLAETLSMNSNTMEAISARANGLTPQHDPFLGHTKRRGRWLL